MCEAAAQAAALAPVGWVRTSRRRRARAHRQTPRPFPGPRPQAASKTNDLAGDGTTTATILSAAMIAEGMKIVAAGANPIQLIRGMEKTGAQRAGSAAHWLWLAAPPCSGQMLV